MSIENREIIKAIVDSSGLTYEKFAERIGVTYDILEHSIRNNWCSKTLVDALEKYYNTDFSFLRKRGTRG